MNLRLNILRFRVCRLLTALMLRLNIMQITFVVYVVGRLISFEGIKANLIYCVAVSRSRSLSRVYLSWCYWSQFLQRRYYYPTIETWLSCFNFRTFLISCMDLQNLVYIVLAVSVVGCACQLILCFTVIYLLVHLKRVRKNVQRLSLRGNNSCNLCSNESLRLKELHLLPLRAQTPGETITVLHRNPHPPLPPEFATTEGNLRDDSGEGTNGENSNLEATNEGFDA